MSHNIFDLTTTDIPFYDKLLKGKYVYENDVKASYRIVYMTPDEYLNICSELQQCTIEELYHCIIESNIQELISVVVNDNQLPLPFLNMIRKTQEGRHRAIVAKRLGLAKMPVMIIDKQ